MTDDETLVETTVQTTVTAADGKPVRNAKAVTIAVTWAIPLALVMLLPSLLGLALLARETKHRTAAIQQSRLQVCEAQNDRHTATVNAINDLFTKAVVEHPGQADKLAAQKQSTLLIISALAPLLDCQKTIKGKPTVLSPPVPSVSPSGP